MSIQSGLSRHASTPVALLPLSVRPVVVDHRVDGRPHFDIYRTEQVHLTSTLFGGGDWHWRLTDRAGAVLADCGGYRNRRDCLAVVEGLRAQAGLATVSERAGHGSTIKGSPVEQA